MNTQQLLEYIQDVLITVHASLDEARNRKQFADQSELEYIEAKVMAYQEVLSVFRMSAREFGLPEKELGI